MEEKEQQNAYFIINDGKRNIFNLNIKDFTNNSYYKENPMLFKQLCEVLNGRALFSCTIKKSYVELYKWIQNVTSKLQYNARFTEHIYWILTDRHEYPKCKNPKCNKTMNSSNFKRISRGYDQYCSQQCISSAPEVLAKIRYTNSLKTDKQKQAQIDKYRATYNKHKEEDPDFVKRKQEKSVATRKRNHGEDYTGRKKCWKTIKERYGVENPMRIEFVQENIKKHNLETYGVEWHIAAPEIRKKSKCTCQKNYGVDNPFQAKEINEKIKQHNLDEYGVEYSWQREDVKQRIKETNIERYGYESAMQNPEIRAKGQFNILYDNNSFDSYPELCLYLWLKDNNIPFEYQPKILFQYEYDGKIHQYCPDFKIYDLLYEIKGNQFFKNKDPRNEMVCPWNHLLDGLYEAKHQCMLKNNVIILDSCSYQMFITYIEITYGKEFYLKLKKQKEQRFKEQRKYK